MNEREEQKASLICVEIALMYMMRPNCHMLAQKPRDTVDDKRWQSHIRFISQIFENLKKGGVNEDSKLYRVIVARVVLACRAKLRKREELLSPILDAIAYLKTAG